MSEQNTKYSFGVNKIATELTAENVVTVKEENGSPVYVTVIAMVASFLIGSGLVPKMDFIPNPIRIWLFASGIGLLIISILFLNPIHTKMSKVVPRKKQRVFGIITLGILVSILSGVAISSLSNKYNGREALKTDIDALTLDISQFVADRRLAQPDMPTTIDEEAIKKWMEQNRQYDANTNNLFISRFQQRIMDIGYRCKKEGVLTVDEWTNFTWITQPDYPVISRVLSALKGYRAAI